MLFNIRISLVLIGLTLFARSSYAVSFEPYFDLSLMGDFYATESASDLINVQLHGRFKLLSQKEHSKVYLDLCAGGLAGRRVENYIIIPQAYITFQKSDRFEWSVGRMVKNFSQLDTYWMMGDVLPLFRWDAARPEAQGLAGAFATYKVTPHFHLDLYGSFLFLPTQGPSFSIVDGKLTSGNPWFSRPVDILALSGTSFDLNYTVNTPDISEIIFRPAVGTSVFLESEDESLWVRTGYFLKQRNELVTPFNGTVNLPPTNSGDIKVQPQVAEHKIATLDLGYKGNRWGVTLSGLYENDVKFDVETQIYPHYSDQYKVGLNAFYQVSPFQSVEFGALKTYNNNVSIQGLSGAGQLDIFSFRNQYDNAVDFRLTSVFFPREQGFLFKSKARVAYDYTAETTLISWELIYAPLEALNIFARMDLFGGERPTDEPYNNLLVNYLDKDRFQAGVKYVF